MQGFNARVNNILNGQELPVSVYDVFMVIDIDKENNTITLDRHFLCFADQKSIDKYIIEKLEKAAEGLQYIIDDMKEL